MSRVLPLITTVDLWRTYLLGSEEINALRGVNFSVMPGQFIAVVGRSGSGKTTLLNILAGLDKPTSGRVMFQDRDVADMSEHDLTELRRHQIGFVFQSFGLLPLLSALENVELPLRIRRGPHARAGGANSRCAGDRRAVEQGEAPAL